VSASALNAAITCVALLLVHDLPQAAEEVTPRVPPPGAAAADDSMAKSGLAEVWVVLSEPALATLPRDAKEQRSALRARIMRQQDDVMAQLAALGAVELGRVQQARNAVAVKLPPAAIENAKKIDGVTRVHAVSHRNRIGD
jgi:hypothetical protein